MEMRMADVKRSAGKQLGGDQGGVVGGGREWRVEQKAGVS